MGIFGKKNQPQHKYRIGQCLVWRRAGDTAYGVVVKFQNDLMYMDIRESDSRILVPGTAHWFTINDSDWSES